ncbi:SseB family protein [Nocardioides sp. GCM10027113]|uniref:SseB family protein n=1 Tax=unclassified Nocardioides TaxID=2615069 RepID=UPI00361D4C05
MATQEGDGRLIPDPGFAGDDGAAPARLVAALAAYAADRSRYAEALAELRQSRLLVPVVAVLGEVEVDAAGLAHDKSSDMATVLLTGRDGRQALLGFSGIDRLHAWNPQARPVPVTAVLAAQSAVQEGADALLVDVAGPVQLVVQGEDLTALAAGWTLGRVGERTAWIRPPEE